MDLGGIEALVGFHPCARACLRFAAWMCECRGRRRVLRRCALDNLVVPLAANAERSWHAEERGRGDGWSEGRSSGTREGVGKCSEITPVCVCLRDMAEGLCKRDCGAELVKLDHVRALSNEELFRTFSSGSKKSVGAIKLGATPTVVLGSADATACYLRQTSAVPSAARTKRREWRQTSS